MILRVGLVDFGSAMKFVLGSGFMTISAILVGCTESVARVNDGALGPAVRGGAVAF
jgi:hypothetical protein